MNILENFPIVLSETAPVETSKTLEGTTRLISGLHSGGLVEVIYSIPTCKLLGITHLIINMSRDPSQGSRAITEDLARKMVPYLLSQGIFKKITFIRSEVSWERTSAADLQVDYNLDTFRSKILEHPHLHLVHAHGIPFGILPNASQAWLDLAGSTRPEPLPSRPYLVLGLTSHDRRFADSYYHELLQGLPSQQIYWIGDGQVQSPSSNLPGQAYPFKDFQDVAHLIAGARLYLGNYSIGSALADGLKVRRLLDFTDHSQVYPLDSKGSPLHAYPIEGARQLIFEALELPHAAIHLNFQPRRFAFKAKVKNSLKRLAKKSPILTKAARYVKKQPVLCKALRAL